jgi:hypothetical protein
MMTMMMSENQFSQSQVHVTTFRGTEGKRQKVSLNRRPIFLFCGREGARFSPNTWSRNMETNGQQDTCKGSAGQPGALLEISYLTSNCSTPNIFYNNYFVSAEDD